MPQLGFAVLTLYYLKKITLVIFLILILILIKVTLTSKLTLKTSPPTHQKPGLKNTHNEKLKDMYKGFRHFEWTDTLFRCVDDACKQALCDVITSTWCDNISWCERKDKYRLTCDAMAPHLITSPYKGVHPRDVVVQTRDEVWYLLHGKDKIEFTNLMAACVYYIFHQRHEVRRCSLTNLYL